MKKMNYEFYEFFLIELNHIITWTPMVVLRKRNQTEGIRILQYIYLSTIVAKT